MWALLMSSNLYKIAEYNLKADFFLSKYETYYTTPGLESKL